MENEKFFQEAKSPDWQSSTGMDVQLADLNGSSEQLPTFLHLNWENSMDQTVPFESALSSIVSSPAVSTTAGPADSFVIRELIGRLGSICNSGEIAPRSHTYISGANNNSTNTSCYSTPLNSPPKLNLSRMDQQIRGNLPISANTHHALAPFSADPGFAERAAKFSCFGTQNFGGLELPYRSMPNLENGKLSRVSSSQSLKAMSQMGVLENKDVEGLEGDMRSGSGSDRKFTQLSRSSTPDDAELNNAREESSISDQITGGSEMNARKRKAVAKGKPKDKDPKVSEENDSNAKRSKSSEGAAADKDTAEPKAEQNGGNQKQSKDNSKPPEPPKDYIHVRARRGQATDSHSLAERVRREKISERMRFLQDLVPGCNKVTGKAVMLDEIINYVQSLQRQVEFLSMKLSTVNPRLDFNMEALLSKDVLQSRSSLPQTGYALDSSASAFPFGHPPPSGPIQNLATNGSETHCSVNPLEASLRRNLGMQLSSLDGFGDASQLASFWADDLQSVVQMGFGQNQDPAFPSQTFHGSLPTTHMKIEL